jgi:hypothetical protein
VSGHEQSAEPAQEPGGAQGLPEPAGRVHQVSGVVTASSGTEHHEPTVAERMAAAGYDPEAILADPNSNPVHRMIAEINIGVRDRGERWAKCHGCGLPYQLTEEWQDNTVCSKECMQALVASIRRQASDGEGL